MSETVYLVSFCMKGSVTYQYVAFQEESDALQFSLAIASAGAQESDIQPIEVISAYK